MALNMGSFGISYTGRTPAETLATIERAEALGVPAYWLTTGGVGPDALTLFGAAAVRTKTIKLGTSIVPTFPRHPFVMVQQAQIIENLAPERLILGVGTSHQPIIEKSYGLPFDKPLEHLREYVSVLKATLAGGTVDFEGKRFSVHTQIPQGWEIPVMISALRANSFRLAGEVADGAITWITPAPYLKNIALPAMKAGADSAGRPVPPLVAHAFISVTKDAAAAARAARTQLARYPRMPFYSNMFVAAGYPEAAQGEWSEAMLGAVVIHGDEAQVAAGLRSFKDIAGANHVIASFLQVGPDPGPEIESALRAVASLK